MSTTVTSRAPALRRLSERVLEATGADDVARLLTRELPGAVGAESAALLVWNRRLDVFESVAGPDARLAPLPPGAPPPAEAAYLLSEGAVIETGHGGSRLLVPLLARSGLAGMLALDGLRAGPRRPLLRAAEARLLSTIATRAALVLENHLYLKELVATERMAALGTMAGMLAHDFRTPMTVIRGYAELIRNEPGSPDTPQRAQTIVDMVARLDRMTRETLDFARSAGAVTPRAVDLAVFVGEMAADLERELPGLRVAAELSLPPAATALLDTDKLHRAVFNIAANARDAMNGKGRFHLEARVEEEPRTLVLVLADEGPGVPERVRATLFEPFVTEGKKGGTGLGLAVARRFVEDHGGSIALEPGGCPAASGACFVIRLPLGDPAVR